MSKLLSLAEDEQKTILTIEDIAKNWSVADKLWMEIFDHRKIKVTKEWVHEEKIRCARDPLYFINNYCLVRNRAENIEALAPNIILYGDMIDLKTYPIQDTFLRSVMANQNTCSIKTRQSGVSTNTGLFLLHQTTFRNNKLFIVISKSEKESVKFLDEVQTAYLYLPFFLRRRLKDGILKKKEMDLGTEYNASSIKALTSGKGSGRSYTATILVMDEAAFIQGANDIWAAASPTLTTTGGKAVIISTPWEEEGFFYDLVENCRSNRSVFELIEIPWRSIPGRDEAWYARECAKLNHVASLIRTELDMGFINRGTPFFDLELVHKLPSVGIQASITDRSDFKEDIVDLYSFNEFEEQVSMPRSNWCNIIEYREPDIVYLIGHDPADDGDSSDNGIAVMRIDGFPYKPPKVVLEMRTPNMVFGTLVDLSKYYNNAMVVVEKNRGFAVLNYFVGVSEDHRLFKRPNGDYGMLTNTATREMLLKLISKFFTLDSDDISPILKYEVNNFKRDQKGKLKGTKGDDTIFSLGVALLALTLFPDLLGVDGGEDIRSRLIKDIMGLGTGSSKVPGFSVNNYIDGLRSRLGSVPKGQPKSPSHGDNFGRTLPI